MANGFIDEFKEFISRGNVMDMAVGVVIGGAFSAIVTSLVDDVIGPLIGVLTGGIDFSNLAITVGSANIMIGAFIQAVINFLIISF
ncbi:MAG: large conductance mechanosensitive channel protein MscL, partial [Lachnospiraceae bacterium]|nr:large conductance mechanosensitive channel protein MscL [Lachnospiraceae bacterium]